MKEYLTYKRTVRNECLRNAVAAVGHYNLFLQITGFLFLTFKFKKKKNKTSMAAVNTNFALL